MHNLKLSTTEALILKFALDAYLARYSEVDIHPDFETHVLQPIKRIKFKLWMQDKFELLANKRND